MASHEATIRRPAAEPREEDSEDGVGAARCEEGDAGCAEVTAVDQEALLQQSAKRRRSEVDSPAHSFGGRRWRGVAATSAILAVLVVSALCFVGRPRDIMHSKLSALQNKGMIGLMMSMMDSATSAGEAAEKVLEAKDALTGVQSQFSDTLESTFGTNQSSFVMGFKHMFKASNLTPEEKAFLKQEVRNWTRHPNEPKQDLHDGNVCDDDEELHLKLCYKKCSLLTANTPGGPYPIRTTAFSCCLAEPCSFANQKWTFPRPCSGYDQSGDSTNNGCPHPPGACPTDHELYFGVCYRRCALDDMAGIYFRHRMSPISCCRSRSAFKCMEPSNVKVNQSYALNAQKPSVSLTEQQV